VGETCSGQTTLGGGDEGARHRETCRRGGCEGIPEKTAFITWPLRRGVARGTRRTCDAWKKRKREEEEVTIAKCGEIVESRSERARQGKSVKPHDSFATRTSRRKKESKPFPQRWIVKGRTAPPPHAEQDEKGAADHIAWRAGAEEDVRGLAIMQGTQSDKADEENGN